MSDCAMTKSLTARSCAAACCTKPGRQDPVRPYNARTLTSAPSARIREAAAARPHGPRAMSCQPAACPRRTASTTPEDLASEMSAALLWLMATYPPSRRPWQAAACATSPAVRVSVRTPTSAPRPSKHEAHQRPQTYLSAPATAVWRATTRREFSAIQETSSPRHVPANCGRFYLAPAGHEARSSADHSSSEPDEVSTPSELSESMATHS